MNSIGAFEAKTHFSQLLHRVHNGEVISITHRGKLVAMLVPPPASEEQSDNVFTALRTLKKKITLGSTEEITKWKEIGRD